MGVVVARQPDLSGRLGATGWTGRCASTGAVLVKYEVSLTHLPTSSGVYMPPLQSNTV